MKTKNVILILTLIVFIATNTQAQDSTKNKIREYHLSFVNLSPLTIQLKYKRQIAKNTFFKVGVVDLSARMGSQTTSISTSFPVNQKYYSAGIQMGIEFRKNITDKFCIFHGPDLGYSFRYGEQKIENPTLLPYQQKSSYITHIPFLNYNLGIMFNITPNILIAGEINPRVSFSMNKNTSSGTTMTYTNTDNYFNFNIQNIGLISVVYRLN